MDAYMLSSKIAPKGTPDSARRQRLVQAERGQRIRSSDNERLRGRPAQRQSLRRRLFVLEAIARRQLAIPDRGLDLPVRVDSRES